MFGYVILYNFQYTTTFEGVERGIVWTLVRPCLHSFAVCLHSSRFCLHLHAVCLHSFVVCLQFVTLSLTKNAPLREIHLQWGDLFNYIFSGAETPISFNALAIVVRVAVMSASRASDKSRFSGSNTFSAL